MVDHKSVEELNDKFLAHISKRLADNADIDIFVNHVRCQSMEQSNELAVWPFDDVFATFDTIASSYHTLENKDFLDQFLAERRAGKFDKASVFTDYFMHHITQHMMQSVVHMPIMSELNEAKLEQNSMVLAKLPQWAYLINIMDADSSADKVSSDLISICKDYRFVCSETEEQPVLSLALFNNKCEIAGIYDLPLRSDWTVAQAIEAFVEKKKGYLKKGMLSKRLSKKQADIESRSEGEAVKYILAQLFYLLDNLDKLKDSSGNAATLRPNPERTADSPEFENYKIYAQYDNPLYLYLD